jgi:hypothetical protein
MACGVVKGGCPIGSSKTAFEANAAAHCTHTASSLKITGNSGTNSIGCKNWITAHWTNLTCVTPLETALQNLLIITFAVLVVVVRWSVAV